MVREDCSRRSGASDDIRGICTDAVSRSALAKHEVAVERAAAAIGIVASDFNGACAREVLCARVDFLAIEMMAKA